MIRAQRPWDTECILQVESNTWFCAYCGEPAQESTEIDHRDTYTYRNCDCSLAKEEAQIRKYKEMRLPKINQEIVSKIGYENELYHLNKRYNK